MKEYRPRLNEKEMELVARFRDSSKGNVLVIGDIHEPFALDGYLEFCKETQMKYNCGTVVFIGDVIDNHYSSYHEADPDGMSAGDELDMAIKKLAKWHEAFPEAYVTIGNHDRMMMRKAYSSGLSKRWIKDYKDVLGVPGWNFVDEIELFGVTYVHGEGGSAKNRVRREMQSTVQGHLHTECYVEWNVGAKHRAFSMQIGCGVDRRAYAMAYAKAGKKPVIGCGVVLDSGSVAFNVLMDLK